MKYNKRDQLWAVQSVLSARESLRSAAARLGADHKTVRTWVARYEQWGEAGLSLAKGNYPGDFKLEVVEHMHQNHLSLFETAIYFGISSSVTRKWEQIYNREGAAGLYRIKKKSKSMKPKSEKPATEPLSHKELLAENECLRAEVAYLKKLRALVEERIARESGKSFRSSKH